MLENNELFEKNNCYCCDQKEYKVLKESEYSSNITRDELLSYYKSSSDAMLKDQVVQCLGCDLVFISPRVDSDIILSSYSQNTDEEFITQNQFRIKTFESQMGKILKKIDNDSKKLKVLDIGCAGGAFLKACDNLGIDAVGVEPNKWLVEWAISNYGVDARAGVLSNHVFEKESFDIITLWDVIEHLTEPKLVIEDALSYLKPGGHLILNFPDYSSIACKALGWKWPFYLSVHLIYFTPKTLSSLLGSFKLKEAFQSAYWQTLSLGYVMERASKYFSIFSYVEKIVKFLNMDRIGIKYNMGQTLKVFQKSK